MAELKDAWKQTAKSFVLALNDLSISLFKTVKAGADAAVEWARKDNPHVVDAEGTEIPVDEPSDAQEPDDTVPDDTAE